MSRLSIFRLLLARVLTPSERKLPKQQASFGAKRLWGIAVALLLCGFILAANLMARSPQEYPAHVTFLADSDLLPSLLMDLSSAERDISCALYMFKTDGAPGDPTDMLLNAMIDAGERGVKLTILMDMADKDELSTKYNVATGRVLSMAGATVAYDDPERRLHAKMCVIDGYISYIGSHNYTYSAMKRNGEVTVRVRSAEAAGEALMYIEKAIGSTLK